MSAKKKVFEVNDRVFAKVRGFPAWPARIMEVANASGSRYKVFFYGTYETATLKKEEIWDYNASSIAKFGKGNQKRKGFAEGMYEIENMPDLKTAEALEAESVGDSTSQQPAEAMDTSVDESLVVDTPPPKTTASKESKTPATSKDKTPASAVAAMKEKTPAAVKEKTPAVKDKTPMSKERTATTKEKSTPVAAKEKATPTVKEKSTPKEKAAPPKKEEPLDQSVPEEPDTKAPVEAAKKKAIAQPEPEVKEEENNEVVVSSSVPSKDEEPAVKSTPADTTTEDEPMKEEEPEENALVINETTPVARTRNNRNNKRKADELTPSAAPPPAKKKNAPPSLNVTPSTNDNHSPCATVSRSGRIIKPKKFVDDDDDKPPVETSSSSTHASSQVSNSNNSVTSEPVTSTQNSSNNSTTKTTNSAAKKEPRKMWVEVKSTGDMIEINLDQDKPSHFESKEAELQWEKTTARNALKFKERVESGDFIPDEVRVKLEEKVNRTEEEDKILKKAKQNSLKMERIRWLKIEQKIIDLDIDIKSYCSTTKPDLESCLKSLNEFDSMTLAPLMLKKQPTIVNSISKLRRYVGPKDSEGTYEVEAEKIRNKAEKIYSKLKSIFEVPEGSNFDDFFRDELAEFRTAVKSMEKEKLLTMVSDPTKKAKKKK